ncbi:MULTISPECIES: SDR family oxidoreductase [Gordonia]|uniref:SDR family oxidoreductase n=1 Tax=Gordonia amicalis TaxID=89053 RepID=A0AAE4R3Z4_9ACTN|nr:MULTISPECIES: SDR family oxidoreductase [Gordonia]KAF0967991.1 Coniferyl-alcohol dehydrogenase [Gordonia sp. YY1]MCR8899479.1 SDR family oxidoreductase [Gordonia sp. GONU]MCZ0914904.1 SDR family oxidoreductase [Gordonia amicalis]MCZ4578558.1 SDR family oxidoreductase [Gordonia amicalis]MCZ4651640.1 SDR family oxidoreductase [Gordonia amicalis]
MSDASSIARTVVITGAASGIGLALVNRLLDREPDTRVIAIDIAACPDDRAHSLRCDLSDLAAIAALDLPDHVDALANVAGVPGTAPAETVLAVNTLGLRALTFAVLERMSGGAVVNVASIAAHRNTLGHDDIVGLLEVRDRDELREWLDRTQLDGPAAYDTSKRAVVDWTIALSASLQARGIRALSVSPGPTETPILTDFEQSMGVDAIARSASMVGRHGTAAESASVIDFLLSPAADWVNGIDVPVEGGLTALRSAALPTPLSQPRARVDTTE